MRNYAADLDRVDELLRTNQPAAAQRILLELINSASIGDLLEWEVDVRASIAQFFPKRRRTLQGELDQLLSAAPPAPTSFAAAVPDLAELVGPWHESLDELASRHIFQWNTYYRDFLSVLFEQTVSSLAYHAGAGDDFIPQILRDIRSHSRRIFQSGYDFMRNTRQSTHDTALVKSLNGLERFTDLPIEFYATRLPIKEQIQADATRRLASGIIAAILTGYADCTFERTNAAYLLEQNTSDWAHCLAFLTEQDLNAVTGQLNQTGFGDAARRSIGPLANAIDRLSTYDTDYVPLPALAQYYASSRRLELSLQAIPRQIGIQPLEIHAYLDPSFVDRRELEESARRGVLLLSPLRPDLKAAIQDRGSVGPLLVALDAEPGGSSAAVQKSTLDALKSVIYRRRSVRASNQPLDYNFADSFPLQNPFLTRYVHVYRTSVRSLLRTFERRNGARLWCSVRRSGKTTACLDLQDVSSDTAIVTQTCASTGQLAEGSTLYREISEHLESGRSLKPNFFVELALREATGNPSRIVFVLDEYETLFGRLVGAVRRDTSLRFTVVQPLLDQLVAFSENNLLILLGQQPNAHYILMDQNQLSPFLQQDSFPLFSFDAGAPNEFVELLVRVLEPHASFDIEFATAIHRETAGHPYLTVKYLVDFVDWLMEIKRPTNALIFDMDDAVRYSKARLESRKVGVSPAFAFFRGAVSEAMGADGQLLSPWLHAVYVSLNRIARNDSQSLSMAASDFATAMEPMLHGLGLEPESFLAEAQQANFISVTGDLVAPRIPLLGRIAGRAVARRDG